MKNVLKHLFCSAWAIFGLIGLAATALAACMAYMVFHPSTDAYVGRGCHRSSVYRMMPLPEQEDAERFPMAVECEPWGDFYSFIIFRAPAEWQECFRQFYPTAEPLNEETTASLARQLAADAGEERIGAFINERKWLPFHQSTKYRGGGLDIIALRDESREYLLVYFINW